MGIAILSFGFFLAGSSVISSKIFSSVNAPFSITFFSLCLALIALLPCQKLTLFKAIKKTTWFYLFFEGLSGILLFRIFLLMGLKNASAWEAGLYMSFTPIFFIFLARIVLKEAWRWMYLVSLVLVTASLLVLKSNQQSFEGSFNLDSLIFLLLAQLAEALMTVLRKKQTQDLPSLTQAFLVLGAAWLVTIVPFLFELTHSYWIPTSLTEIFALLHYGLLATALAYFFWAKGTQLVTASTAGIISVIIPISAQILSLLVFREPFYWYHAVSTGLALLAVFILNLRKGRLALA
jgi:drug/metabolite transporter (DMT)-like permease